MKMRNSNTAMSRNLIVLPFVVFLFFHSQIHAQQDAHYSQYLFNGLILNPAYAGSRGTIAASAFYRKQWAGFDGAPTTQSLSFHLPDRKRRYGFGGTISNESIGYVNQQWLNLSYAFRFKMGPGNFAMGLQGGFLNYRVNWDKAFVLDANDPVLPLVAQNLLLPNVGAGLYYNTDFFFAGFSVPHILNSGMTSNKIAGQEIAHLYRHYLFTTGYVIGRVNAIKWRPSVLVKYAEGAPLQIDFNLNTLIVDRLWLGVSYRSFDSMIFMTEFLINNQFKVGYAYDLTVTGLRNYNSGSHEFMISYEFQYSRSNLISPRYF